MPPTLQAFEALSGAKSAFPHLSVVIPAYNEAARLPKTLETLDRYLANAGYTYEIVIVDDGSTDKTVDWLHAQWLPQHAESFLIRLPRNRGKGYAVKTGMLAAKGYYRLLYDADGATPIEEIERFWPLTAREQAPDVLIGSRAMLTSDTVVESSPSRRFVGRVFNAMVQTLVPQVGDTQCGFKLFRANVAYAVFHTQRLGNFAFDVEILHILHKNGYRVSEVPINWFDQPGTKIHLVRDSLKMFFSLGLIAFLSRQGRYDLFPRNFPALETPTAPALNATPDIPAYGLQASFSP